MEVKGLNDYRKLICSALEYGNGTHGFDDVCRMVSNGEAHFWDGPNSCVVTEIVDQPGRRSVNFFLAAGRLGELAAMTPKILDWYKKQGCTHATLAGRPGWERSFLSHTGWHKLDSILMEKEL
jgi:hypothetical protein